MKKESKPIIKEDDAIGREVDDYNNECITQSVATGFLSLAFSLIFFIHKLLFFALIFILKIMLLIINLLAELVIVFLFIPLILLIYDNSSKISTVIILLSVILLLLNLRYSPYDFYPLFCCLSNKMDKKEKKQENVNKSSLKFDWIGLLQYN